MTIFSRVFAVAAIGALTAVSAFAQDSATSEIAEMQMGNPDAAVTVVEYASFTCPHCANFHADGYPQLKSEYIDEGLINFVYREVYFDRPGLWASIVARCGEGAENRFFGISEMLYERQGEWRTNDPAQVVESLKTIGRTAGLSDSDLDACLTDAGNAEALYLRSQEAMEADGVRSTPTFIVNGETVSGNNYDALKSLIDDALADAG